MAGSGFRFGPSADRPRAHHYRFARFGLRQVVEQDPRLFAEVAQSDDFVHAVVRLWTLVGRDVKRKERVPAAGIATNVSQRASHVTAVVRLPPPERFLEAYFIAVVVTTHGEWRYFTLERGESEERGRPETMLGEWTSDDRHLNHGYGPAPLEDLLLACVEQIL